LNAAATPDATALAAPFLLIDAGNTRIKWALADTGGSLLAIGLVQHHDDPVHWPAWQGPSQPGSPSVWISNVAGAVTAQRLSAQLQANWPHAISHTITTQAAQCGVINGYRTPAQLGSDRWAGLLAARAAYPNEHVLIATCGTATTLEALRADGTFCGGLLAPGWTLMMQALGQHTAQLPLLSNAQARDLLPFAANVAEPEAMFAQDTESSISRGSLLAQAGLIERAWKTWSDTLGAPVRLVLSGGGADAVAQVLPIPYTRHDHLVLAGLGLIAAEHLHRAADSGTVATGRHPAAQPVDRP